LLRGRLRMGLLSRWNCSLAHSSLRAMHAVLPA
jgi:hypothetical protein